MGKVGQQGDKAQSGGWPRYVICASIKAKTKEEKWDTKSKVVKTHKKKIVVGEEKGKPTEQESSFMDGMQKVKEWNWYQPDHQRE